MSASGFRIEPCAKLKSGKNVSRKRPKIGRASARSCCVPPNDLESCRKDDQRPREPQGTAGVVERILDLRGELGQFDQPVTRGHGTTTAQAQPGEHHAVISSNLRHLGDHVTDRGRIADEVVVLRPDLAMQPNQVEPLVVENRRDRSVGFSCCRTGIPTGTRSATSGDGQDRRVDVGHPDDDILRPLLDNGSQSARSAGPKRRRPDQPLD